MSSKRAAAYLVLASLLIAWLASAAGVPRGPAIPQPDAQPVKTAGTETLAGEIQAQTARLKERLAAAPAPQDPSRNPFAFAPRRPKGLRPALVARTAGVAPIAPAPAPVAATLSLIGIAEDLTPEGIVRAAVITADGGEVFLLKTGETLGARYRVASITADAVVLTDLASGATRRLALR